MSAVSRNYVYEVKITNEGRKKPEPTISVERIEQCKENVAKYLSKSYGNKN